MVNFRFHRGSFHESMKTSVEVNSLIEIRNIIINKTEYPIEADDLTITFYANDPRIDTGKSYLVAHKFYGVIGWTDGVFE